jgi:hypothetical protein
MDHFRKMGRKFGYPECCIDNFINLIEEGKSPYWYMRWKYGKDRFAKTGYVRCSKCRNVDPKPRKESYQTWEIKVLRKQAKEFAQREVQ